MGSRANGQERILERSSVQNGGFIKAEGQDPWAERAAANPCCLLLPQDYEGQLMIYFGMGGSKDKGSSKRIFICQRRFTGYRRPCYCQTKVVFPSSKALTLIQLGASWRYIITTSSFFNGLQVIWTFNFIYISFCLCFPHPIDLTHFL